MDARRQLAAAALALACLLLVTGCGDDDTETGTASTTTETTVADSPTSAPDEPGTTEAPAPEGTVIDITVEGGTVTGGGRHTVPLGETVVLRVTSDAADEVHVHGYDLYLDLVAGEPAELTFPADIPGVFEAELHGSGVVLAELQVQ